jgi:DNA repair protein RecN (Recombination protein N)
MKVASGGELSRFLLALKVALADRGSAPTLVFDEIDTGVGGAVADAIGQRLKRLSAQGAGAVGDACAAGGGTRGDASADLQGTGLRGFGEDRDRVATMEPGDRTEEIARMLAGASVTEEARAAAKRLLAAGE